MKTRQTISLIGILSAAMLLGVAIRHHLNHSEGDPFSATPANRAAIAPSLEGQPASPTVISGLSPEEDVDPQQAARYQAQLQSVVDAAKTGGHLERRTTMVAAKPFDLTAYQQDPDGYLNVIEPGRIFQSAKPGPGVKVLALVGDAERVMSVESTETMMVRTEPMAPVTFHSSDGGGFENGLSTITVRADADGLARARYKPAAGTFADVHITAASPLSSGRVLFILEVENPQFDHQIADSQAP